MNDSKERILKSELFLTLPTITFIIYMRIVLVIVTVLFVYSCEPSGFEADKRQIRAKDEIRATLPARATDFDIASFREDTLHQWSDSNFKAPLRYFLEYSFKDSTGNTHHENGWVVFTPDGKSVIQTTTGDSSLIH
jgi:hypothetical protein